MSKYCSEADSPIPLPTWLYIFNLYSRTEPVEMAMPVISGAHPSSLKRLAWRSVSRVSGSRRRGNVTRPDEACESGWSQTCVRSLCPSPSRRPRLRTQWNGTFSLSPSRRACLRTQWNGTFSLSPSRLACLRTQWNGSFSLSVTK